MNFATKQLTEALQQVNQEEEAGRAQQGVAVSFGRNATMNNVALSSDVSEFLERRKEFLKKAQDADYGSF